MINLREQWNKTWAAIGLPVDTARFYEQIVARYSEAHRRYHTLEHLSECFERLSELNALEFERPVVELAIWFHDAVYDPQRPDNEKQSAEWCGRVLKEAGVCQTKVRRVEYLILTTQHTDEPRGIDAEVLVDVDLAILGASRERFSEYEQQIRVEYAWVPDTDFRRRRRAMVEGFLSRRSIYHTVFFRTKYEAAARENLIASLARLS